jgi:hypothetical protein
MIAAPSRSKKPNESLLSKNVETQVRVISSTQRCFIRNRTSRWTITVDAISSSAENYDVFALTSNGERATKNSFEVTATAPITAYSACEFSTEIKQPVPVPSLVAESTAHNPQ